MKNDFFKALRNLFGRVTVQRINTTQDHFWAVFAQSKTGMSRTQVGSNYATKREAEAYATQFRDMRLNMLEQLELNWMEVKEWAPPVKRDKYVHTVDPFNPGPICRFEAGEERFDGGVMAAALKS